MAELIIKTHRNCIVLPIRKRVVYGDICREGSIIVELRICEVLRMHPSQNGEITLSFTDVNKSYPSRFLSQMCALALFAKLIFRHNCTLCSDYSNKVNIDTYWINVTYRGS